jgi:hypothetical protein
MWARDDVGESLGVALDLPSLRRRPPTTVWPLAANSGPAISPIKNPTTATNGAMIIGVKEVLNKGLAHGEME